MHPAFRTYKLNEAGATKAAKMAEAFDRFLAYLDKEFFTADASAPEATQTNPTGIGVVVSRERSLLITKLEEASFIGKKALSIQTRFQAPQS